MFYSPKKKNNYREDKNDFENNNNDNDKKIDNNNSNKTEITENETKNEKLEFQNQIYNLKFGYISQNNSLFLELCPKNVESLQTFYYYKGIYSYIQLTKICKLFKMCDSIQEIFSSLCVIFKNKKALLKNNEQNSFNIVLLVSSITGNEEEVNLPLEKQNILKEENDNKINTYYNNCQCGEKLNEINLKIENVEKNLMQENYELKNEIYYLKNDINKYIKTIENNKKEIKSLKEQMKNLKNTLDKIINTNRDNKNFSSYQENNNYENAQNLNEQKEKNLNLNIQKETKSSDFIKKSNKINVNNNLIQDNKKKNERNETNQSKASKNQEKMKNNKREIYKQLKEENAKKLNNNKNKSSFRDFLNQRKLNSEKNKNKGLVKSYTSTGSNILSNKKRQEKIKEESEHDEREDEINIDNENGNVDTNTDEENFRYKNIFQEEEKEEKDENLDIRKSKDINRAQMIDDWTEDFNINVKKLLEDNEIKLRFTEKLNFMNRSIITKVEELQLIENQLMKEFPEIKNIEYNLIYRASEHGDSAKIFHEKCNEENNLILIKINDIKFGGYTKENWDGINIYKKDNNAFCFCLNNNKIYKVEKDKNAILCDSNMGPCFGDKFIQIFDNFLDKGGKCYNKENCGYIGTEDEITNRIKEFTIEEIEVYKLNFYY